MNATTTRTSACPENSSAVEDQRGNYLKVIGQAYQEVHRELRAEDSRIELGHPPSFAITVLGAAKSIYRGRPFEDPDFACRAIFTDPSHSLPRAANLPYMPSRLSFYGQGDERCLCPSRVLKKADFCGDEAFEAMSRDADGSSPWAEGLRVKPGHDVMYWNYRRSPCPVEL